MRFQENYYPDYLLPLKKDIPCLEYDFSCHCDILKNLLPDKFPSDLYNFQKYLNYWASRKEELSVGPYPGPYRIYIIDNRLNILFVAVTFEGKMPTFFSKYGKFGTEPEIDEYYGDGRAVGDAIIDKNFPETTYDKHSLSKFAEKYGFIPVEDLAMSTMLIFEKEKIADRRLLTQFQTALLMEKFHAKNLVNWKKLIRNVQENNPFLPR